MWCSTCQQDAPALGSPRGARCGKCGQPLAGGMACAATRSLDDLLRASPLTEDDWLLAAELRGVERLMGSLQAAAPLKLDPPAPPSERQAASAEAAAQGARARRSLQETARVPAKGPRSPALAAWLFMSLGLAAFACGAVLLVWSVTGGREDLWPLGLPLVLIGQTGLITGLVLQLDGLWHTSRNTEDSLGQLDEELARVRQATTLLSTTPTSPAQSFYVHLAEGASPPLLLADLKGQLDLLAQQMAASHATSSARGASGQH